MPDGSEELGLLEPERYVNGPRIQWSVLLTTVFGAGVLAYFEGLVRVFFSIVDIPLALLGGLADFGGQVVDVVAGIPAAIIERGWAAAIPFVIDAGLAGFVVAVAVVLATFYSIEWVVSRVRE
jgi:hypothetical protein